MSWRYSTGLRNALLEDAAKVPHAVAGTTISLTAAGGAGGESQILDSANGLAGFLDKAYVTVLGSATTNNKTAKILSVDVGGGEILVAAGTYVNEAAGPNFIIASAEGGSYRGVFRNMQIKIYTGAQPASADDAETGSLLCTITLASGAFVVGAPENGLNFGQVGSAQLKQELNEVWSGANSADGTAGWFRILSNSDAGGASTTESRLDGACATSGAQMNLTNTTLVNGVTTTIDQVALSLPAV